MIEATGEGHCALPLELLKDEAGKLLLVDDKIVLLPAPTATTNWVRFSIHPNRMATLTPITASIHFS